MVKHTRQEIKRPFNKLAASTLPLLEERLSICPDGLLEEPPQKNTMKSLPSIDPFAIAAQKYAGAPGDAVRVYRALCSILSERAEQADWDAFTADDWQLFAPIAEAEGVAPLMYWKLRPRRGTEKHGQDTDWRHGLPFTIQSRLSNLVDTLAPSYYQTLAHNTLLFKELERILAAFDEAGIEVIVLKGAALAQTVYEDIGLRPMGDIDLLIHQPQIGPASQIVHRHGYVHEKPELWPGLSKWISYEENFDRSEPFPTHVELHWNLIGGEASRYRPEIVWFWEQAWNGQIHNARLLSAEAHLLYLAAHLKHKHRGIGERLLWLHDIHRLISNQPGINWQACIQRAENFGWMPAFFHALLSIRQCFDTPLPDMVIRLIEQENLPVQSSPTAMNRISQTLRSTSDFRLTTQILLILALIFPSPEYLRWRYQPDPTWKWPLCYLARWLDILHDILPHQRHRKVNL